MNSLINAASEHEEIYRSQEQRKFASHIEAHLSTGGPPLLIEGAAGLGKTRAYLAPLLQSGLPVAVCVPTRALATQLVDSADLAALQMDGAVEIFTPRRHFDDLPAYRAHKAACHAARLLVCTHQAALLDVLSEGALLGLAQRHAIVFDEADQLPDAAALRFDCKIEPSTLRTLGVSSNGAAQDHRRLVSDVLRALDRRTDAIDEPAEVRAACRAMLDALDDPVWYQTVGFDGDGTLWLKHQLPARAFKHLLSHPRLIFVSATLSINGTFGDFQRAIGIPQVSPWSAQIEPKAHGALDVVSEAWDVELPDHLQKVAQHLAALEGAVLVITTSYDEANALAALIEGATLRDREETTGEAAARMGESNVLIAAGAWAGLDTPVRWRHVVMPRAPYGAPTILDNHEISRYVDSRNTAIRRFRQGLARGLRTPDAICTLHLLDGRFDRAEFINSLPKRFERAYKARFGIVEFRTQQSQFRELMLKQYGGRCPISGCDEPSALEAAHLGERGGWRTNHTHGILLRRDLHALLDAGKLQIINDVVHVKIEHYLEFDGKRITVV